MILVVILGIASLASAQDASREEAKGPAFSVDESGGGAGSGSGSGSGPERGPDGVGGGTGAGTLAVAAAPRASMPERVRCHRFPGVRVEVCDSPRRVPEPTAEAAARATRLGLGTHEAADRLYVGAPPEEWIAEVGSAPREDLLWPVANGLLSRRFGVGRIRAESSGTHPGVDVVAAEGTLLRAVNDALVAYADNGVRGMGNSLWLVHADGSVSIYAHCRALRVSAGELVRRGQIVGELGATGLTFRAHLHYELRVRGVPQDPFARFVERPSWRLRVEEGDEVTWLAPPPNQRVESPTGVLAPEGADGSADGARTGAPGAGEPITPEDDLTDVEEEEPR